MKEGSGNLQNRRKAAALITSIFITLLFLIIVAVIGSISIINVYNVTGYADSLRAFYVAESGRHIVREAVWHIAPYVYEYKPWGDSLIYTNWTYGNYVQYAGTNSFWIEVTARNIMGGDALEQVRLESVGTCAEYGGSYWGPGEGDWTNRVLIGVGSFRTDPVHGWYPNAQNTTSHRSIGEYYTFEPGNWMTYDYCYSNPNPYGAYYPGWWWFWGGPPGPGGRNDRNFENCKVSTAYLDQPSEDSVHYDPPIQEGWRQITNYTWHEYYATDYYCYPYYWWGYWNPSCPPNTMPCETCWRSMGPKYEGEGTERHMVYAGDPNPKINATAFTPWANRVYIWFGAPDYHTGYPMWMLPDRVTVKVRTGGTWDPATQQWLEGVWRTIYDGPHPGNENYYALILWLDPDHNYYHYKLSEIEVSFETHLFEFPYDPENPPDPLPQPFYIPASVCSMGYSSSYPMLGDSDPVGSWYENY